MQRSFTVMGVKWASSESSNQHSQRSCTQIQLFRQFSLLKGNRYGRHRPHPSTSFHARNGSIPFTIQLSPSCFPVQIGLFRRYLPSCSRKGRNDQTRLYPQAASGNSSRLPIHWRWVRQYPRSLHHRYFKNIAHEHLIKLHQGDNADQRGKGVFEKTFYCLVLILQSTVDKIRLTFPIGRGALRHSSQQ